MSEKEVRIVDEVVLWDVYTLSLVLLPGPCLCLAAGRGPPHLSSCIAKRA